VVAVVEAAGKASHKTQRSPCSRIGAPYTARQFSTGTLT